MDIHIKPQEVEYLFMEEVKPVGNSGKISCKGKYLGKKAIVVIFKENAKTKIQKVGKRKR